MRLLRGDRAGRTDDLRRMRAEEIAAEDPKYNNKGAHDGSDGECDCIGLIIGAIRRAGGSWRGIHGSNYAARNEVEKLEPIAGSSELQKGEVVFKSYEPGQGGYSLPGRYEPGGSYYTGDLRDYYHVGMVESVYPLRIRHMTKPKVKMDTSIGKWAWHGKLKKLEYEGSETSEMEKVIIQGGNLDAPINMRMRASTTSGLIMRIPQGSEAELIVDEGSWKQIRYNGKTGFVQEAFVQRTAAAAAEETMAEDDTIPKDGLLAALDIIEKALDSIYDLIGGRG